MMQERRNGASPIPTDPELYINAQQVHGLIVLKKFGWKLVCIRRCNDLYPSVILKNKQEGRVALLECDGILKLTDDLHIRNSSRKEKDVSDEITNALLAQFDRYSIPGGWNSESYSL
jgi:hypothetical protein